MPVVVHPPGLPEPIIDEHDSALPVRVNSSWDELADTLLRDKFWYHEQRRRVKWLRYSSLYWCCWRPMRIAACERQSREATFGWVRDTFRYACCGKCGRIKDML